MRREQGGLGKHLVPCDGGTYRKRRPKCMPRFGCDLSLIALVVRPWATRSLSGSSAEHSWSASIQVVDHLLPIRSLPSLDRNSSRRWPARFAPNSGWQDPSQLCPCPFRSLFPTPWPKNLNPLASWHAFTLPLLHFRLTHQSSKPHQTTHNLLPPMSNFSASLTGGSDA